MAYNMSQRKYAKQERILINIPVESLPESLQAISQTCSHETALALWLNFGGCHLSVPKTPFSLHQLTEVLGWQAFCQLCANFGGEILSIPKAAAAIRQARNERIKAARAEGVQLSTLARQFDLTERHIMEICSKS